MPPPPAVARFGFAFEDQWRPWLRLIGVTEARAGVTVTPTELVIRFGSWRLRTDRANVAGVERSGSYAWYKAIGVHLSLADRGITFGTSTAAGACLRFHRPVPALLPTDRLAHPGATVTVADPDGLEAVLGRG